MSAPGAHVVTVAAPQTLVATPTMELLQTYFPSVPIKHELPGRDVPVDLRPAETLIDFHARHIYAT